MIILTARPQEPDSSLLYILNWSQPSEAGNDSNCKCLKGLVETLLTFKWQIDIITVCHDVNRECFLCLKKFSKSKKKNTVPSTFRKFYLFIYSSSAKTVTGQESEYMPEKLPVHHRVRNLLYM